VCGLNVNVESVGYLLVAVTDSAIPPWPTTQASIWFQIVEWRFSERVVGEAWWRIDGGIRCDA
jgi:hypothetical protein